MRPGISVFRRLDVKRTYHHSLLSIVRSHGGHSHSHSCDTEDIREDHRAECRRVTVVGGASNLSMAAAKIYLGSTGGSYALLADGMHALVDFASDVVSYASVSLVSLPIARCRFPFGLGRIETTGAVIVSAILLVGGGGLMWASGQRLASYVHGTSDTAHDCADHGHSHDAAHGHSHFDVMERVDGKQTILWKMVVVAALSLVVKEWLFRWTKRVGERAHSRVVVANAYHHRADAWCSGVALVGVGGHLVGVPILDAVAGVVVSFSIAKIGWELLSSSVLEFFDYQYVHDASRLRDAIQKTAERLNPPAVNVFGARHGASYVLHSTFIVTPTTSAAQILHATNELSGAARTALKTSEHYCKFIHIPSEDEIGRLERVESSFGEARVARFLEAAREIELFHGISVKSFTIDPRKSSEDVSLPLGCHVHVTSCAAHDGVSDCLSDLRSLARAFQLNLTIKMV